MSPRPRSAADRIEEEPVEAPPAPVADTPAVSEVVVFDEPGRRWKGAAELVPFLIPIGDAIPHPRNPRRGNVPAVAESLSEFGQLRPIVLGREGVIVAGNHTRRAGEEILAWTHIAAMRPGLTASQEERFLIADNRTSDLADYDDELLVEILREQQERGDLAGTGWTPDEVDDLATEYRKLADADRQTFEGSHAETPEELAARAKLRQEGAQMREVVLMVTEDVYASIGTWVKILRAEWGSAGVTETVVRAVREAALRVNQGEPGSPAA